LKRLTLSLGEWEGGRNGGREGMINERGKGKYTTDGGMNITY